jgi:hypothetical protein
MEMERIYGPIQKDAQWGLRQNNEICGLYKDRYENTSAAQKAGMGWTELQDDRSKAQRKLFLFSFFFLSFFFLSLLFSFFLSFSVWPVSAYLL